MGEGQAGWQSRLAEQAGRLAGRQAEQAGRQAGWQSRQAGWLAGKLQAVKQREAHQSKSPMIAGTRW